MNTCSDSKLIAQTIFLGSSVSSFNCNLGWSGQPSQLTVNLVDDINKEACKYNRQFPSCAVAGADNDNYYYSCSGDNCYMDRDGSTWSSGNIGRARNDGSTIMADDKLLPGKLYYKFDENTTASTTDPFVSKYWYYPDPGFLGNPNRIDTAGNYTIGENVVSSGFDIIGTPVYFKMDNFTFGGIVQSWEENFNSGGKQYKVVVEGMQSVLSSCYIIVGEYGGSIFSKYTSANYGAPRNYVGNLTTYAGHITEGNIPNVFNVYGFLESNAPENFGGSNCTEDGLSAKEIMFGLRILTSSIEGPSKNRLKDRALTSSNDFSPKTAYSPHGRILVKKAQEHYTYTPIATSFKSWGVIPPTTSLEDGNEYCEFLLDISEVVNPPDDFRIKGPVISILDFLNQVTEATGYDYTVELLPIIYNNSGSKKTYNVIKIKTISRLKQPTPNQISNTVKQLYASGYNISSSTIGKEKNESPSRCLIVGGKQQRLLQAKSYRLAYTQSNLIFDTYNRKFVDYIGLGSLDANISLNPNGSTSNSISRTGYNSKNFSFGKIRFPSFLSTRNMDLSNLVNSNMSTILADEENIRTSVDGINFVGSDTVWPDSEVISSTDAQSKRAGNYEKAKKGDHTRQADWGIKTTVSNTSVAVNNTRYGGNNAIRSERYFPLYKDIICPFFGYLMDNEYDIDTTKDTSSADFRRVRPVFYDTWTGQICVLFRASELPKTRIELEGLYGGQSGLGRSAKPFSWNPVKPAATPTPAPTSGPGPGPGPGPGTPPTSPTAPGSSYPSNGSSSLRSEYLFMVTESEMRAALMGQDEFLIYCVAKTYKPDLYLMMNQAYINKYRVKFLMSGKPPEEALDMAQRQCDWSWGFTKPNIASMVLSPTTVSPDRPDGPQDIEEDARRDFQLLQQFVKKIADQFYGKKYMVQAPYLGAKRDSSFADLSLPTEAGYAYVFRGDSKLKFNYEPTNEGAWEEYGNIIDDCIAVGSKNWHSLTDDRGLIKPIVGYNVTDTFDRVGFNLCNASIGAPEVKDKVNSYFCYSAWEELQINRKGTCDRNNYIFPSIDTASLSDPTRYVIVKPKTSSVSSFAALSSGFQAFDAGLLSGDGIVQPDAFGNTAGNFHRKKMFHITDVEEKFAFLNPETLQEPRFIINAPGISLNSASDSFQKDPNITVIATIAVEDASVYLRSTPPDSWDNGFIEMLSSYLEKAGPQGYLFGNYAGLSKNTTAQNVTLKPRMAHPFFVGIPIKSNQYNYGPWTNYPYFDAPANKDDIFPTATIIDLDYTVFPLSASTRTMSYGDTEIQRAIKNWIYPTTVTVNSEFVPWNYGGMSYLDAVAFSEVKSKINYQAIIETASVEMAGLPMFNLGGAFNDQAMNNTMPVTISYDDFDFIENKRLLDPISAAQSLQDFNQLNYVNNLSYSNGTLKYRVIKLPYNSNALSGPIISTIGVDIGQNGVKTSYMFRTYTRKLSLFNKEYSDRIKKSAKENLNREKQFSKMSQQMSNRINNENLALLEQKLNSGGMSQGQVTSKLVSWSPVEVIVASAGPYLKEPIRSPDYVSPQNSQSMPSGVSGGSSATYSLTTDNDIGTLEMFSGGFSDSATQIPTLINKTRIKTTTQIYQKTELGDFLKQDYGTKSVMSLDGVFSPVSFYPTNNLSTFAFSKYDTSTCPVCAGTGKRTVPYKYYAAGTVTTSTGTYDMVCNACCNIGGKLHASLDQNSKTKSRNGETLPPFIVTTGTDILAASFFNKNLPKTQGTIGNNIPINLVSLQPLIVPYSEFKNPNTQNYTGVHPDGFHGALSLGGKDRKFIDRSRHSISVVGRSAVHQKSIEIYNNIDSDKFLLHYPAGGTNPKYNADFFHKDMAAIQNIATLSSDSVDYEMNQRFIGLRGPLVMHGWGYDQEGYPVPNAADEPLEVDGYGRPKRFAVTRTLETATTWDKLSVGDVFVLASNTAATGEMVKALNLTIQNTIGYNTGTVTATSSVQKVIYKDDLTSAGIEPPTTYKGSIVSKTQKEINGKWTPKQKLKEFYLNWGEHPELWPVGPIDLRWDESRKVWTANTPTVYKMMYITLEEDLTRHNDLDETYPARGFLDDVDFSSQPMPVGSRRLVFVKDRCGYTAPRGAKILCRYDGDSGFYEPISKPTYIVKGSLISGTNQANIEMSYIQGKRKGENYPTMVISYDNPFGLTTAGGAGLFTYINGKWTLTTSK